VITAVVQDRQQTRQAFDHLTGFGEEQLRYHQALLAPDRNQMPIPELLMHLGDRHPHQFGDPLQVINRLVGL
jgi:alpha-1,6-mannosyltransferase